MQLKRNLRRVIWKPRSFSPWMLMIWRYKFPFKINTASTVHYVILVSNIHSLNFKKKIISIFSIYFLCFIHDVLHSLLYTHFPQEVNKTRRSNCIKIPVFLIPVFSAPNNDTINCLISNNLSYPKHEIIQLTQFVIQPYSQVKHIQKTTHWIRQKNFLETSILW